MAKEVSQLLGSCRVKCSSTIASRGENNHNALSIATALDGDTTMFLQKKKADSEMLDASPGRFITFDESRSLKFPFIFPSGTVRNQ